MKKLFAALLLLATIQLKAQSLSRYLITFKNKANSTFTTGNPSAYLSPGAIERRLRYSIAIDSTDLPVSPSYLDSVRLAGNVTLLNVSRWLNQVSIQTNDAAALAKINSFAFVQSATPIASRLSGARSNGHAIRQKNKRTKATPFQPAANYFDYGASLKQVTLHNGEFLHNIGLRGQGMVIGILDAGFFRYTTLKAFDSANLAGQVLGTYDFVARENSVVEDDSHGMQCFSVMAANIPSQFVGTAPKAGFLLFRTEDAASEYRIEEHNWVCGAERTDSAGGDVISSSLGYSDGMSQAQFNYTYAEMNGRMTIAAKGATLAARKGILVVNSAGNQGGEPFRYIATPADADSVLAVGAVDINSNVAGFSSYGPSADKRIKPDVASLGVSTTVQTSANTIGINNGTSFATPNMAGLATCLWQGFQEATNIQLLQALRLAGNKALTPDDRVGYGVPDMKKATLLLLKQFATASVTASSCKNTINWNSKDITGMKYEVERKAPGETVFSKLGEKAATGTIFSQQQYQWTDSLVNLPAGAFTYRVRQVIDTAANGGANADYIDTVTVSLTTPCITTPITPVSLLQESYLLLPNPAQSTISLRITTPSAVPSLQVKITDSKGSLVATRKTPTPAGTSTEDFSLAKLASGTYYLSVYKEGLLVITKVFIRL